MGRNINVKKGRQGFQKIQKGKEPPLTHFGPPVSLNVSPSLWERGKRMWFGENIAVKHTVPKLSPQQKRLNNPTALSSDNNSVDPYDTRKVYDYDPRKV